MYPFALKPMISYAQNAEDVVLRRVFHDVKRGVYVDIGACDPVSDSVTNHFYQNGWHGVNVEPDHNFYKKLRAARRRDRNVCAAVWSERGSVTFHPTGTPGHGTLDPKIAAERTRGTPYPVKAIDLVEVFDQYVAGQNVDFLKIDVEGSETNILASANWGRHRPRVVVVEAVDSAGFSTHDEWEHMLFAGGYHFALFDGLNRFYCRQEDSKALLPLLSIPANVLDNWRFWREIHATEIALESAKRDADVQVMAARSETHELVAAVSRAAAAEVKVQEILVREQAARAAAAESKAQESEVLAREQAARAAAAAEDLYQQLRQRDASIAASEQKVTEIAAAVENLRRQVTEREALLSMVSTELARLYQSRSWKLTRPLRAINYKRHRAVSGLMRNVKSIAVSSIFFLTPVILRTAALKKSALFVLNKFPVLKDRIRGALLRRRASLVQHQLVVPAPELATAVELCIRDNERIVLLYVEHTAIFSRITGIQRVCHKLAAMLESWGERVILVKLDHATLRFAPLSLDERQNFFALSGRDLAHQNDEIYAPATFEKMMATLASKSRQPWLIIPEVTYHTTHPTPPTSRLIKLSRDLGLRVGVIFYDVIPFLAKDAAENALKHANYMSTIALADVIWPISHYSRDLLVDHYRRYEKLNDADMPVISVTTLGEEMDTSRQLDRHPSQSPNIVCVGTIDERKNQIALVKAFNRYCEKNPDTVWKLHVIGLVRDSYKQIIEKEASRNPNIELHSNASDEEIKRFYMNCDFTVFPSLEEGYGLPIIESLWNVRPCICANFGSMAQLAVNGGCLAIDTRSVDAILSAITSFIEDEALYQQKIHEITQRPVKTWFEYAGEIVADMDKLQFGKPYSGLIYYWIDATLAASGNTGIQRVTRQLAKQLIMTGHKLVPIKWDADEDRIVRASRDDLAYMARWNGPVEDGWQPSFEPDRMSGDATYLMVELPLNRPLNVQRRVIEFFKQRSVQCVAIFYDAIPFKLASIYPPHFTAAHQEYMEILDGMDLVLPISVTSANDLTSFLNLSQCRALALEERIKTVELPSEFPEIDRSLDMSISDPDTDCQILVVGTVEPRKNHETLIRAFFEAERKSTRKLKLTLVGGDESFDKELPHKIEGLIGGAKNIYWIKNASDEILRRQYTQADFIVFPSFEEGFGLPIVESLWFGVPCICSSSGQMAELAAHGGCELVDVLSIEDLSNAIVLLANDPQRVRKLKEQIRDRHFRTWADYAAEVSGSIRSTIQDPVLPGKPLAGKDQFMLPRRPVLSICITTYNRASWLAVNLENLMRISTDVRDKVEIVVCDNCSSDDTPQVAERFRGQENFFYYRNTGNIGMLGNLSQTVSHAHGDYVWLIGDDDLLHKGSLERILQIIGENSPDLINVNYSYSPNPVPPKIQDLESYIAKVTKICDGIKSGAETLRNIAALNENFFTAIYSFVVKKKHAERIFTQDTSGAPFTSLQTCVPSSKYILTKLLKMPGYWINEPQLTINMNVSWGKYAPLWILERVPEVYDLAEANGVAKDQVDHWRRHTLQMVIHYFEIMYQLEYDPCNESFDIVRFIRRSRHLDEFRALYPKIEGIYARALQRNHPLAKISMDTLKTLMQ